MAFPSGSNKLLGYAYPPDHSDDDDLVDGFEYAIGTNPNDEDTDADGESDSAEYPVANVPESDPRTIDPIFADGFD